jgi:tRNA pseudouridine13 synthase
MKLKQRPEDFHVEELTDVAPDGRGPFAFYRLEKRGWTTPDAIQVIRGHWQIERQRVAYGGLKDRHADTVQYLSIFHGPQRDFTRPGISLRYLGRIDEPYSSRVVRANRFRITLRDLAADDVERIRAAVAEVDHDGIANYFDDQRFGSVGRDGEFIAKHMVLGRYEEALRQALEAPYEFDRAEQRREKATLRECWGRWAECKERLPRGHARSLVDYLVHHPTDFRGAVARLRPELQGMYLSAYQSHLWNRILSGWLGELLRPEQRLTIATKLGAQVMPRGLTDEQRTTLAAMRIALPAARSPFDPDAPWAAAAGRVLGDEGLSWSDLKLRGLRKPFFTRGEREALVVPGDLTAESTADDLQAGKLKLQLAFLLPRGSYATMVIKRVTARAPA